jgi:hypothetical protein
MKMRLSVTEIIVVCKKHLSSVISTLCHFDDAPRLRNEEESLPGQTKRFLVRRGELLMTQCHFFLREGLGLQVGFKMTGRSIYVFLFLLLTFSGFAAQDPAKLFSDAALAYRGAQYKIAIDAFEELRKDGFENTEVFYNLGNAYFKDGQLGRSILNFERASRLAPRDEQVKLNLTIARARLRDKVEAMPLLFIVQWWNSLKTNNNDSTLFLYSILLLWLTALAFFIFFGFSRIMLRRVALTIGSALVLLFGASVAMVFDKNNEMSDHNHAIVMSTEVVARSTCDATGVDIFQIHEGLKVEIIETKDTWEKIRLTDGKIGWVAAASLERI